MSALTKEHFEQVVKGLLTKDDLKALATKDDLAVAEQRITQRIGEAQEELARMVSAGFEDLQRRLDVTEQVREHERKLRLIADALHISF